MADNCQPQIQVCRTRVARLETSGIPDPGATNLVVSDSLIQVTFSPVIEAGDEITLKNGCGTLVTSAKRPDSIKRWGVQLNFATPDPYLHEMILGGAVLTSGTRVGYGFPELGELASGEVSLEFWARRVDEDGNDDPDYPYARWVFPRCKDFVPGERVLQNAGHESPISGFATQNLNWFDGPANDWPVASTKAVQWLPVDAADVPVATCGYSELIAS